MKRKHGKEGGGKGGPAVRKVDRRPLLSSQFMEDLEHWIDTDRKVALRLLALMNECLKHPMTGTGKPEPLKRNWQGWWSRRLTGEHRIVYRADDDFVEFAQARFHYDE